MTTAFSNVIDRRTLAPLALLVAIVFTASSAIAQEGAQRREQELALKQIAPDLHFFFDYNGSNAVFLVTDEGVLLIDTRTHPRVGQDLLERIRKVTDKPIKWVRSEEHTSELQSHSDLVCRLLLEKKKKKYITKYMMLTKIKPTEYAE